ncbi:hypothetical protein ES703_105875 [subsurface metagenome]
MIYTYRIMEWVETVSANATKGVWLGNLLTDAPLVEYTNDLPALIDIYIKQVAAHEAGHMMRLAVEYNKRFGGYHYKSGTGVMLDEHVYYTDKKGKVTWYIRRGGHP